jgi:aspartyl-tRNA(Asn)/glutamyl-tRNA(Gln) amidotransferase subunit C
MSKKLTRKKIKHLADLAMLDITSEEIDKYIEQLGDILEYFEILNELDVEEVKVESNAQEKVLRRDSIKEGLEKDVILSNREEDKEDNYLKV